MIFLPPYFINVNLQKNDKNCELGHWWTVNFNPRQI